MGTQASSITTRIVEATRLAFGLEAHVVGPGVRTGIKIRTEAQSSPNARAGVTQS